MKRLLKYFLLLCLFLLPAAVVAAKELPVFALPGNVTHGRLASGIEYYLIPQSVNKGYADFALVQLSAPDSAALRSSLCDLPHFRGREPYRFLAEAGVGYRRHGYLRTFAGAAVFEFHEVPVYRPEVADSLCLMLFDIAAMNSGAQALMICGDIDAPRTVRTLSVLSLMTPPAPRDTPRPAPSRFHPLPYEFHIAEKDGYTALRWEFRFPRLNAGQMNTPLPFVLRLYTSCLSLLLETRIREAFRQAGLPLSNLEFRYRDSSDSPRYELYSVRLNCFPQDTEKVSVRMASVLASLCEKGADPLEFEDAMSACLHAQLRQDAGQPDLVDERALQHLVNYYLFGAPLASSREVGRFFSRRQLPLARATELFNAFVRELLSPAMDGSEGRQDYVYQRPDSNALLLPVSRVRLLSDRPAPEGGRRWTFSNGMKVIYRHQNAGGHFRYAISLPGGYHRLRGLKEGEGPYISDLMQLEEVAGMRKGELRALLRNEGVRMQGRVSLEDFRLEGDAPSDKYPLLFKTLLAMSRDLEADTTSFAWFKACETLSDRSFRNIDYLTDSVAIAPYLYSPLRRAEMLEPSLQRRAHQYFKSRFEAMNEALIVLTGDIDEVALKKFLCRYLGDFQRSFHRDRRLSMTVPLHAGSLSFTVPAERKGEESVNIAMYARLVLTRRNLMALRLAQEALEKELVRSLADKGLYAELSSRYELLPEEWVCLRVRCRPCVPSGLPEGIAPDGAGEAALALRAAVDRLKGGKIAAQDLSAWKEALARRIETLSGDPGFYISSILQRNVSGKDFLSDYHRVIREVTAEDLQKVLSTLYDGCRIEYTEQ